METEIPDEHPLISGGPVIDGPKILDWPPDREDQGPFLSEPTSNLINDLHAGISQCDMVLSTAGNYHMALRELWDIYLAKFPADAPLRNWLYTTSPPIAKQQISNGLLRCGNLTVRCRPQVAVGPQQLIDSLVDAGYTAGEIVPFSKTRGNVLLVKKGNPKDVRTVWDLGRRDIRVVTPSPSTEAGSFNVYADTIYNIARNDDYPLPGMTAQDLFNAVFNMGIDIPGKWLSGKLIHHREVPWSIAYGRADAAVIFYHLAVHAAGTFPDLFEIVSLGGTPTDPRPLPGNYIETLYAIRITGVWSESQHHATEKLMDLFQSHECTIILDKHGLDRP